MTPTRNQVRFPSAMLSGEQECSDASDRIAGFSLYPVEKTIEKGIHALHT